MTEKLFLQALRGELTERVPFWFMRQAGRYLPEYRALRSEAGSFLDLCFDPEKASEVTLQPLRRFGMDAAILFSDILVIPHALGVSVQFAQGEGPVVGITNSQATIDALTYDDQKLSPIYETIRLTKKQMDQGPALGAALIGFVGAPWTVACYMLQGRGGKEFAPAREFAYAQPALMQQLIDRLTEATITYLRGQIAAGVDAVQIFDSWAGLLTPNQFAQWVIAPTQKIVAALTQSNPETPIIGFAKGAGLNLASYAKTTGVACIGVDQHTPMDWAIAQRGSATQAVQGNLDPLLLASDQAGALAQTDAILQSFATTPAVFNVGHGFVPHTPIENVAAVAERVKAFRRAV